MQVIGLTPFARRSAVTGVIVALVMAPSTALASNGWSTPTAVDRGGRPDSVSCASASFCVAVDQAGRALTFNGSSWTAPAAIDSKVLWSVSCPSASFCAAVDLSGRALMFNGSSWTAPAAIETSVLSSVSCPSASFCVALGTIRQEQQPPPLPPPLPPPPPLIYLVPGAWTFNGSAWRGPTTIGGAHELGAVSCASASFCAAVGLGGAVTFNGRSWTAPAGIEGTSPLDSVSCASASFCAAVDVDGNAYTYAPGAEPTPGWVTAALSSTLAISGRAANITQLLRHGGYTASFTAPSAGRLVIGWYYVPKGATVAKAKKPVLVAGVQVIFHKSRRAQIKIALTKNERQMLKTAKRLMLTAKSSFTPTRGHTTITTTKINLKR